MERYSHADRSFHASVLAMVYQTRSSVIKRDRARLFPGLQPHETMPVFVMVTLNMEQTDLWPLVRVTKGPYAPLHPQLVDGWWGEKKGLSLGQTWLRPRMSQLVGDYRDGKVSGRDVRIVAGAFQLGLTHFVYHTVRLERLVSGRYEPTYCVSRFADILRRSGVGL